MGRKKKGVQRTTVPGDRAEIPRNFKLTPRQDELMTTHKVLKGSSFSRFIVGVYLAYFRNKELGISEADHTLNDSDVFRLYDSVKAEYAGTFDLLVSKESADVYDLSSFIALIDVFANTLSEHSPYHALCCIRVIAEALSSRTDKRSGWLAAYACMTGCTVSARTERYQAAAYFTGLLTRLAERVEYKDDHQIQAFYHYAKFHQHRHLLGSDNEHYPSDRPGTLSYAIYKRGGRSAYILGPRFEHALLRAATIEMRYHGAELKSPVPSFDDTDSKSLEYWCDMGIDAASDHNNYSPEALVNLMVNKGWGLFNAIRLDEANDIVDKCRNIYVEKEISEDTRDHIRYLSGLIQLEKSMSRESRKHNIDLLEAVANKFKARGALSVYLEIRQAIRVANSKVGLL